MTSSCRTRVSFLDLPAEVRNYIYDLAILPARLYKHSSVDPEHVNAAKVSETGVPALFFICQQIYNEVVDIFYSRATLAVEPWKHGTTESQNYDQFLQHYARMYSFCPSKSLRQIRNVHIYSGAFWPVQRGALQALFRWLIVNTDVCSIWLSRKAMQQWRSFERPINLAGLKYGSIWSSRQVRTIDIITRRICPRMRLYRQGKGLSQASTSQSELEIQAYSMVSEHGIMRLRPEPDRSFSHKDQGCSAKKDLIIQNHDRLVDKDFEDHVMHAAYNNGTLGLCCSIIIQA